MRSFGYLLVTGGVVGLVVSACNGSGGENTDGGLDAAYDAPPTEPLQTATVTITARNTRFVTRDHFLASAEMQISGEPFAEDMGRLLTGYSRDHLPTDIYFDTAPTAQGPWIDLPGFSTAVESYEYSKQPMNFIALESSAGTSLVYGPLVNLGIATHGASATTELANYEQHFAQGSNALGVTRYVFPPGTYPAANAQQAIARNAAGDPQGIANSGNLNYKGVGTASENPIGWPGIWPTVHPFRSFDPTINPTGADDLCCAISSDDDPGSTGALSCADYECDYSTLHLADRTSQIESVIAPGADGFSAWKFGLWVMNYLQIMHDSTEAAVSTVAASDLPMVGQPGNTVVGYDSNNNPLAVGTYLGSSNIEGFQAQTFIEEVDNRAQDWLMNLSTTDGATLSGFSSVLAADSYDYGAPLRWFPTAINVVESDDASGFPLPAYSINSPNSALLDMMGLVLAYSTFYAVTDSNNVDVGGAQTALCVFDGDPFPTDDGMADGENTLHDRALAMIRVALIDIDRMHGDPTSGILVDDVTMNGATVQRGTTVSTTSTVYSILGMRTALRSLSSQLELYSNNTPDTAIVTTVLDGLPINHPTGATFSQRVRTMMQTQGDLLYDSLTDATGRAYDGWDISMNAPVDTQDLLDSHTAAIRGLFAMYLATGDAKYRDRAIAVYQRLDATFYDATARVYGLTAAPVATVDYTPIRFALLQSALRDVYELIADHPGGESLEPVLEERVSRLNNLVLNGWDDRNQNREVDWPGECMNVSPTGGAAVDMGILPLGGLHMAERTLTGEIGNSPPGAYETGICPIPVNPRIPTSDREHDCVPEIDDAHLPSALASQITLTIAHQN
jgi:hypothetical protein